MKKILATLLSIVLLFLCFFLTLQEFLFTDDIQNFFLRNSLVTASPGASTWQVVKGVNTHWMAQGRFTPLSFLWQESVFMKLPTVMAYRWFVLLMNFAGIGAFLYFLYNLGIKYSKVLWMVCFCAVLQFRIQYHDVYTSLHGMYQLLAVLLFTSLSSYVLWVKTGRWYYLLFSLLLYAAAHLHTEVGIAGMFFIPATGLLLNLPFNKLFKHNVPYVLITALYLLIVVWLKVNVPDTGAVYSGLQSNLALDDMWSLFVRQVFATLPFSNLYGQVAIPQILFHRFTLMPFVSVAIGLITVGLLVFSKGKTPAALSAINPRYVFFLLLLMVVPALFILPSSKYQRELQFGTGYLPVYIQNFGTATLLAYFIDHLWVRRAFAYRFAGYLMSAAVGVAVAVNFLFNSALINARMCELSSPVIAQYQSLKDGILKDVPEGSRVVIPYFWNMAWIYDEVFRNLYSRSFEVINEGDYHPSASDTTRQNCYVLETLPGTPVYTKLYPLSCTGFDRGNPIEERIHTNTLQQTEQEKLILHRIFNE